ncbi:hypothetical protein NPS70_07375 [Streptomyces sp. C10-9-1]|uniref:hypothetical protein n=1 Tax=Streptomyces sp. C10-9-1 TaxID=1859285 RepID=UPI002111859F|nr:hypothetical protein [Streptomyces sp. C10-9-1]MCQ6553019.1 hypothetical protein [Streptomyces sp. C10-9-1]
MRRSTTHRRTVRPVPEGLTRSGADRPAEAKRQGVRGGPVNTTAMDCGPVCGGDVGGCAIRAAAAVRARIGGVPGLSGAGAWRTVAVTW